jgi:2-polyprenyl-6-methoxyphenol hydroxylase-like FAD-dependent oxidoreductase
VDALSGDLLTTLDFGEKFKRAYMYPYLVMHRSDLLTILLDACQQSYVITLETNREVVAVDDLDDGDLDKLHRELIRAKERLQHKKEIIKSCSRQCGYSL